MPKINRYSGDSQLTRQAPAQKVNPELGGVQGQQIQAGAQALQEVNQRFAKLDNARRYTEQSAALSKDLNDLQTRAENDSDLYTNRPKYLKEMEELQKKHTGDFYDPEFATDFQGKAGLAFQNTQVSIDKAARKGLIDSTLAQDIKAEEQDKYSYKTAPRDAQGMMNRQAMKDQTIARWNKLEQIGALSKKEVAERTLKMDNEWGKDQALYDMDSGRDPMLIAKDLDSGAYGITDSAESKRLKDMNTAMQTKRVAQNKAAVETAQTKNMMSLMEKKAAGTLTLKEADMVYQNDGETPGITLENYKYLQSELVGKAPKQSPYDSAKIYNGMIEQLSDLSRRNPSEKEVEQFQNRVIALRGQGYLDDGQFEYFIKTSQKKEPSQGLSVGVKMIMSQFLPPPAQMILTNQFMKELKAGKMENDSEKAIALADSIIRAHAVETDPAIGGMKELPNATISRTDPLRVVWDRKGGTFQVMTSAKGQDGQRTEPRSESGAK